jgi:hypothetical protein
VHCTRSCICSQKCSWGWANLTLETCKADLKRSINGICFILLVAYIVEANMFVWFHVPLSPVHIQSSCRIRTAIHSCVVCMCIFMGRCLVTCKPSIPVILWRYVQVGVTIAYMNGVEFFTKLSWIHYPKSIYQTRNFAMRGGETPYYIDQSTNGDIFMFW